MNGAIDLSQLPCHKIHKSEDNTQFEKDLNDFVRSGWQIANIQTQQVWSESKGAFQYSYLAILVKQGILNN